MRWKNLTLAFLSGILLILIFPKFNLSFLAWVALVPLFLSLEERSPRESFNLGFLAGLVSFAGILYWIGPTIVRSGESKLLALISVLLLSSYLAVYYGVFCLSYRYASTKPMGFALTGFIAPSLWVSFEFLRGRLFSGFPWALLGYSQWNFTPVIQISEFTGVYGVSFLIVMVNSAITQAIKPFPSGGREKVKKNLLPLALSLVLLAFSLAYGFITIRGAYFGEKKDSQHQGGAIRVALLQGNIDQYMKWDDRYEGLIKDVYSELVDMASKENPELIVWPETALPGYLRQDRELREWVEEVVGQGNAYHIVGSPEYREGFYYNAAFLISPQGEILAEYDKIHLVPFGEVVPLRPVLSHLVGVLNELGDFSPSRERKLLKTPFGNFAVLICWEGIFPHLVRRFVKDGTDYLTNITNDAWFLKTAGPFQHFIVSVFRAVENRVSVIRVANTGVSAFIDSYGRIEKKTEVFEKDYLTSYVYKRTHQTFYTKYGDIFAYLCMAFSSSFIGWRRLKC